MAKKSADTKKSILPEAGNLEQIRDILFGKSMKEFENRFAELERSLIKEVSILRDDAKKMFSTLESYVKEELNSYGNQLKTEAEERDEADQKLSEDREVLSKKLSAEKEALAKKFSAFEKESNKTHSDIRSQILDLTRKFSDELSDSRAEIMDNLKRSANELQNQKTDRSKLASLLTEMALRISDDELPEDKG